MAVWLEGECEIDCDIERVTASLTDLGAHYAAVVAQMPGMTTVDLVDNRPGLVRIRTNEGLMTRSNITVRGQDESIVVEYDEEYEAGRMIVSSHHRDDFSASGKGIRYRTVVSDLTATGVLGFFYQRFGRSSMRNAFLLSYRSYLEQPAD